MKLKLFYSSNFVMVTGKHIMSGQQETCSITMGQHSSPSQSPVAPAPSTV